MNIRDFIYYMPIIISIIGIVSIILALKTKDKKSNKCIIVMNIINIIYLISISLLIPMLLPIIVDLGIIIIWFLSFCGGILYIISISICLFKRKKLEDITENKNMFKYVLIIVLIPIILFMIILGREIYLIKNSNILLSYYSAGNGGFGDSDEFTYVINDKYCKEISIAIRYSNLFIPKSAREIDEDELQSLGYNIVLDNDNYILIYKNNELIHKERINESYFNINLKKIYYNE